MADEHWTERLSEYIDGELAPAESAAVEAHLAACAECRETVDSLQGVVATAAELTDIPPARDLWPGIESRLAPRRPAGWWRRAAGAGSPAGLTSPGRRIAFTVPQLLAAAIALVVLSAGGAWLAIGRGPDPSPPMAAAEVGAGTTPVALVSYEAVILELEAEFERRRDVLEPATILVLERNLAIIDQAIAEARLALEADPSSGFLNAHLAGAMRRKADLLRQAAKVGRTES